MYILSSWITHLQRVENKNEMSERITSTHKKWSQK